MKVKLIQTVTFEIRLNSLLLLLKRCCKKFCIVNEAYFFQFETLLFSKHAHISLCIFFTEWSHIIHKASTSNFCSSWGWKFWPLGDLNVYTEGWELVGQLLLCFISFREVCDTLFVLLIFQDFTLLEYAWMELLEKKKAVTAEELAVVDILIVLLN